MNTGQKLRDAREAKGLSVAQLARTCGVTEKAVRLWESNAREPLFLNIAALAEALGLPMEHFLPDEEDAGEPAADKAVHR